MKALVKRGSGDMGIENIAEPTPQKHETHGVSPW